MGTQEKLLEIERGFWTGDGDHYRRYVDDHCLTVFTEMAGVMSAEEIAGTVEEGRRWEEPELKARGLIMPTEDVAVLTYEARTVKPGRDGAPGVAYHALVSSGYVRRDDGWKMMFHQQTPMPLDSADVAEADGGTG